MNDPVCAKQEPVAIELLSKFHQLADRAVGLSQRTDEKLSQIARPSEQVTGECAGVPEAPYPPLFANYREAYYQLQRALDGLEDTLRRVEI